MTSCSRNQVALGEYVGHDRITTREPGERAVVDANDCDARIGASGWRTSVSTDSSERVGLGLYAAWTEAVSASITSSPYRSSFSGPTPGISASSSSVCGRARTIASSVRLPKTWNAGTPSRSARARLPRRELPIERVVRLDEPLERRRHRAGRLFGRRYGLDYDLHQLVAESFEPGRAEPWDARELRRRRRLQAQDLFDRAVRKDDVRGNAL